MPELWRCPECDHEAGSFDVECPYECTAEMVRVAGIVSTATAENPTTQPVELGTALGALDRNPRWRRQP